MKEKMHDEFDTFMDEVDQMTDREGGPAFPVAIEYDEDHAYFSTGMTRRDYFAAKAMQAIIAKAPLRRDKEGEGLGICYEAARGAYDYADAMLAVAGKEGK